MDFRKFFNTSEFKLLAIGDANWDYYTQQYNGGSLTVVSLAKEGTGCSDSCFGDMKYFKRFVEREGGRLQLTTYAKDLLGIKEEEVHA